MRFGARHGPTHVIGSVLVWFGALVICFLSCSHFAFCGTQSCRLIGSDWAGSCAGDSGLRARTGFPQRRRYFRHGKTLCFVSSAASNYRAETPGKPQSSEHFDCRARAGTRMPRPCQPSLCGSRTNGLSCHGYGLYYVTSCRHISLLSGYIRYSKPDL